MSEQEMSETEMSSSETSSNSLPAHPPDITGMSFRSVYTTIRSTEIDNEYPYRLPPCVNRLSMHKVPHYEYHMEHPPLSYVGTAGDIWVDLAAKQVFYRTRTRWKRWHTTCAREENRTAHPYFYTRYLSYSGKSLQWISLKTLNNRSRGGQPASITELVDSYIDNHLGNDDVPSRQGVNRAESDGHSTPIEDWEEELDYKSESSGSEYLSVSELREDVLRLERALLEADEPLHIASEKYEETQTRLTALTGELQASQARVGELETSRERSHAHAHSLDASLRDAQAQVRSLEACREQDQAQLAIESAKRQKLADQLGRMRQVLSEMGS